MQFSISKELLEAVVNYLASRPYIETFKLINGLSNLSEVKKSDNKKDPEIKK